MSLLRTSSKPPTSEPACACQAKASTGHFSLRIEPRTTDVRDSDTHNELMQLQQSERLQNLFLPNLGAVPVHQHGTGFHMHPEAAAKGTVAHIESLHDMMDDHNLLARVQVTPSAEDTAVAVSLTRDHVSELMTNGVVDLEVPVHETTIRLHSTQEGRITAAEYVQ